jgi:hypothetical protein
MSCRVGIVHPSNRFRRTRRTEIVNIVLLTLKIFVSWQSYRISNQSFDSGIPSQTFVLESNIGENSI